MADRTEYYRQYDAKRDPEPRREYQRKRREDPDYKERRREYMREWRKTEAGRAAVRRYTEAKAARRGTEAKVRGPYKRKAKPEPVQTCPQAKLIAGSYMCACHGLNEEEKSA